MLRLLTVAVIAAALLLFVSCVSSSPGTAPGDTPGVVDTALLAQLQARLDAQLAAQGGKGVADVSGVYFDCTCALDGDDANVNWDYNNTGDYDQNSEVNASDLVPIGVNFGATSSDTNWPYAKVADGDKNGEVNFADVTPIGINFGSVVSNYVVEADIDGADNWQPVANAPFSEGVAPPSGGAIKEWVHTVPYGARAYKFRAKAAPEVPLGELYDLSTLAPAEPVVDPGSWTEMALSPENENWAAHNAVALVGGKPALVYTRDDRKEIYYAYATVAKPTQPSDWVSSVLDDADNLGGTLSLCEADGVPCVSYEDTTMQDVFVAIATTATPSGTGDWNVHEPDSLAIGQMHLANVNDVLRAFYRRGGSVMYAAANVPSLPAGPGDWLFITVDDQEQYDFLQIIGVDNRPALAYQRKEGGFNELVFAQAGNSDPQTDADWDSIVVDDINKNSGNWVQLRVDDQGNPVIGYTNVDIVHFLKYAYANSQDAATSGVWTTLTVYQQEQTHLGNWLGLGMYGNKPLMSYIETGSGSTDGLHVAYATEAPPTGPDDFARGILDDGATYFVNEDTSVLILADGTPAVFYRTSVGLKYQYYTPPD